MKKIEVNLSNEEVLFLTDFTKKGMKNAREIKRAYILLMLHRGFDHQSIIDVFDTSNATIWRIKWRYNKLGAKDAIVDEERTGQPVKYTKKDEAEIIATACSDAPEGRSRWTLDLLKEAVGEKSNLKNISREAIRLILKKTNINLG